MTYARTKGWDIGEVAVDVVYDNKAEPRRFDISISLSGAVGDDQLARLEKAAAKCPLRRALETGFEFHEHIRRCDGSKAA